MRRSGTPRGLRSPGRGGGDGPDGAPRRDRRTDLRHRMSAVVRRMARRERRVPHRVPTAKQRAQQTRLSRPDRLRNPRALCHRPACRDSSEKQRRPSSPPSARRVLVPARRFADRRIGRPLAFSRGGVCCRSLALLARPVGVTPRALTRLADRLLARLGQRLGCWAGLVDVAA